jgi:hypothetical protein
MSTVVKGIVGVVETAAGVIISAAGFPEVGGWLIGMGCASPLDTASSLIDGAGSEVSICPATLATSSAPVGARRHIEAMTLP